MAGVLAAFVVLAAMWSFDQMAREQQLKDARERAQQFAHVIHKDLTSELAKRLSMVDSLAAFWRSHTDSLETSFPSYAASMLEAYASGVRNLQLAPGGVVTYIYPIEGNESALGFKILDHPYQNKAAARAIDEQGMVVAGPFELVQGGVGIVARRPLFLPDADETFWGFATVILDFPPMLTEVKIHSLHSDYVVAIRGKDGLGARGDVFFGRKSVFDNDPVLADVSLPNGSWQIAVIPENGWLSASNSWRPLWLFGAVIAAFAGVLAHWLVLTMQRLHLAQGRAEKASKDKSTFLAAASHDMRQPLQAMHLFLYALKKNEDSSSNLEIIAHLEQTAACLGDLLDRLLDLSRLESGVVKIEKQKCSIRSMFGHLVEEYGPTAADKGLRLDFVSCALDVFSDPILLEDILRNLIANAIKNTERGRVLIGCRRKGADELQIQVWDTGKGISEDQQLKIFDEFYQLGVNSNNAQKGLGLGLSIVQKVAALLNHKVGVSSEPGRGTVFSITVPLVRSASVVRYDQAIHERRRKAENLSIIVIDDDEEVRKSLSVMLGVSNNRVASAPRIDCQDGAKMLGFPLEGPDIIIADYRLENGMTGVQAIASLRRFYEKDVPAILLTGDTAPDRLQEIAKSGYALLHKPVGGDELLMQIQEVLSARQNTDA